MIKSAERKPCVLIVDDSPENVEILGEILRPHYRRLAALDGEKALKIAASADAPDLILLDVVMPGLDGYQVCRRLKSDPRTSEIPVIFITSRGEVESETRGFDTGAVDYIAKPVSPPVVLARVKTHLELRKARESLSRQNEILEQKVRERTEELALTQEATILSLASLAETRDNETGGHILRTQSYVRLLAERLARRPGRGEAALDPEDVALLYKSSPLHDIGKVGIPDAILLKPARLTPAEFEIMKRHTTLGRDALLRAESLFRDKMDSSFFRLAREIAYSHHEKWNGQGYPEGLVGGAIPLPGRLMAVADVYDALVTSRIYKPPVPHSEAVRIMAAEREKHFDPDVLEAFLELEDEFRRIALQFVDRQADRDTLSQKYSRS
jgi:putative two-component system response regulator